MCFRILSPAVRADAFYHIFSLLCQELRGKRDLRDELVGDAEGLAAPSASEMHVRDVVFVVFAATYAVFAEARAIVNLVQEVVCGEKTKSAEDARLLERRTFRLNVIKAKSAIVHPAARRSGTQLHNGAPHQKPHRRQPYSVFL